MQLVVSAALREFLESQKVDNVEFLPVPIFDHKKKQIADKYFIINLLDPVDCLLTDQCEVRWGRIDKTDISRLKKFVIDESRVPTKRRLFRPKHYKSAIMIHRGLAEQLDRSGKTGLRWVELTDYPEI